MTYIRRVSEGRATLIIMVALCALISRSRAQSLTNQATSQADGSSSFLMDQARALLESTMNGATGGQQGTAQQAANMFSTLGPNNDPQTTKLLRDNVNKVTELINNYRQNGLSNMPNLPALPGLNSVMRVPDKLLRAELSMLQILVRMAQDMTQNPISATMNTPKDFATMLQRVAQQLEQ